MATSTIKKSPSYKLIGSKQGLGSISLGNYSEFIFHVEVTSTVTINIHCCKNELSTSALKDFRGGYYYGPSSYCTVGVVANSSNCSLNLVYLNSSTDITSDATLKVYAK